MRALKEDVSDVIAAFERAAAGLSRLRTGLMAAAPMQRDAVELALTAMVAGGGALLSGPVETRRAFVRAIAGASGQGCAVVALDPRSRFEDLSEIRAARLATPHLKRPALSHPVVLLEGLSGASHRTRLALAEALGPCRFVADQNLGPAEADRLLLACAVKGDVPAVRASVPGAASILAEAADICAVLPVGEQVLERTLRLVRRCRPGDPEAPEAVKAFVRRAPGPRTGRALIALMRARALMNGRAAATDEDLRALVRPALEHRIGWHGAADRAAVFSALSYT